MDVAEEPRPIMKKKEKQALKHELFLKRPYTSSADTPCVPMLTQPHRSRAVPVSILEISRAQAETQSEGAGRRRDG